MRLARDILDLDEFRDLALPGGLAKRGRPVPPEPETSATARKKRPRSSEPPSTPGTERSPRGRRIRYEELPFDSGPVMHSRFVEGIVQANTLHPDYLDASRGAESRLAYAALMIGKESIAYNDRTGAAGDFLEKLLDFAFKLQARSRKRGRRREQTERDEPPALPIAD